jgi:prevent-host-death family protein
MKIAVDSYEAQTKLAELLRGVQTGKRYTITLRGEAVAELVPPQGSHRQDLAAAVEDMRAFMRTRQPVAGSDLKALIEEGRATQCG